MNISSNLNPPKFAIFFLLKHLSQFFELNAQTGNKSF